MTRHAELQVPDPPLGDGIVRLRPWDEGDVMALVDACTDSEIARWTTVPSPYEVGHAQEFVGRSARWWEAGLGASFAVVDATTSTLLGAIDLKLVTDVSGEAGYWVARQARGRGVAVRALRLLSTWAFRCLDLQVITLQVLVGNEASIRVAEAADYVRVGKVESDADGSHHEALLYARSSGDGERRAS